VISNWFQQLKSVCSPLSTRWWKGGGRIRRQIGPFLVSQKFIYGSMQNWTLNILVTNSNRFDFVLDHFDSKYLVWHIRAIFREYLMIATSSQIRADLIGKSVRFCVDRHMKRRWKCVHHHFLILNFIDNIILSHIWSASSNLETSVHVNLTMLIDSSRPGLRAGMVEIFQIFWPIFSRAI
jgi:hypothetical protein